MAQALSQDLASQFRQFITAGRWEVGSQLPPLRQLAEDQGVSVNTARAAMQELAEDSLIDWRHGRRGVVTALPAKETSNPRRGRPKHIGLLGLTARHNHSAMPDSWVSHIAVAVENVLVQNSDAYLTRLGPRTAVREQRAEEVIEQIAQFGDSLTGVVIFAAKNLYIHQVFDALDQRAIPWVAIDRPDRKMMHNFVAPDYLDQGRMIGDLFARRSHQRVWIVAPDPNLNVGWADNIAGVYQGFIQAGQSTDGLRHIKAEDISESAGFKATLWALEETKLKPQAIYATGDYLAIGAIRALRQMGLNVPEDVEVIGGTGLDFSIHTHPALSVLAQPMEQIGRQAAQMLLSMQQSGKNRCVGTKVASEIIFRGSTAPGDEISEFIKNCEQELYQPEQKDTENIDESLLAVA